jgi:hypothetical protein
MKDLVLLVADKNMQYALQGALQRPSALNTAAFKFEFRVHAGRDGGVRSSGAEVLRSERRRFHHALMVLDFEGCGAGGSATAASVEANLDAQLRLVWESDAKAIVIKPELEAWVWGGDNAMQQALSWPLSQPIRDWLSQQGFAVGENGKPERPKEAFEALVPVHRLPRSSTLYKDITDQISLANCKDAAFLQLRETLRSWFPPSANA